MGRGGHVDGPSEDAKFSNDFDVVYIGSSCSLLVIDRGNQAIREIQLPFDDCAYQYGSGFPLGKLIHPFDFLPSLRKYVMTICKVFRIPSKRRYLFIEVLNIVKLVAGIVVLVAAGFFGYMIALLQRRVGSMISNQMVSSALCY